MQRDRYIDIWKGLLILLVVLGHAIGGGCHLATGENREYLRIAYFVIYAFHMPAFFFLAGWLWHDRPFGSFLVSRVVRLLLPYFVVGVISILIFSAVGGDAVMKTDFSSGYYTSCVANDGAIVANLKSLLHGGFWPNGQGFRYNSVLWFLPCLFLSQMLYFFVRSLIRRFRPSARSLVGLVFFAALLALAYAIRLFRITELPWCLDRVPYFMIFLALGSFVHGVVKARGWTSHALPRPVFAVVTLVLAIAVGVAVWAADYRGMVRGTFAAWSVRLLLALFGTVVSMMIAKLLSGMAWRVLAPLGVASLTIMLWHKFFVVAAQVKVPYIAALYRSGVAGSVVATLAVTVFATLGAYLIHFAWTRVSPGLLSTRSTFLHGY